MEGVNDAVKGVLDDYSKYWIRTINEKRQDKPVVIIHIRHSSKANNDQNLSDNLVVKLEDKLKDQYFLCYIYADSRKTDHGFKTRTIITPFVSPPLQADPNSEKISKIWRTLEELEPIDKETVSEIGIKLQGLEHPTQEKISEIWGKLKELEHPNQEKISEICKKLKELKHPNEQKISEIWIKLKGLTYDWGKLLHLKLLLEMKKNEQFNVVIGNTSGTLDLAAFVGHHVCDIHISKGKQKYQDTRIQIQHILPNITVVTYNGDTIAEKSVLTEVLGCVEKSVSKAVPLSQEDVPQEGVAQEAVPHKDIPHKDS